MVIALRHGTDLGRKNPCRNKDVGGCSCWTYAVFHGGADAAGICGESEDEAGNPDSGTDTGRNCVVAYHTLGDSVLPASCTENKHISDACAPCWNLQYFVYIGIIKTVVCTVSGSNHIAADVCRDQSDAKRTAV